MKKGRAGDWRVALDPGLAEGLTIDHIFGHEGHDVHEGLEEPAPMRPAIEWWARAKRGRWRPAAHPGRARKSWLLAHAGRSGFAPRSALAHAGRAVTSMIFVFFESFVAFSVVTWRQMCRSESGAT